MPATDEATWNDEQITAVEAQIRATNSAILALVAGAQSYMLDTGQTRQTVTKANLTELRNNRKELLSERQQLIAAIAQQTGASTGAQVIARPGW